MRNNSYAPHYAISRYSIREFKTGAEPFMVAMIIILYIISRIMSVLLTGNVWSVSTRVMCGDDYAIISWREVMVKRLAVRRQEINTLHLLPRPPDSSLPVILLHLFNLLFCNRPHPDLCLAPLLLLYILCGCDNRQSHGWLGAGVLASALLNFFSCKRSFPKQKPTKIRP